MIRSIHKTLKNGANKNVSIAIIAETILRSVFFENPFHSKLSDTKIILVL